jgi:hypothetical protein
LGHILNITFDQSGDVADVFDCSVVVSLELKRLERNSRRESGTVAMPRWDSVLPAPRFGRIDEGFMRILNNVVFPTKGNPIIPAFKTCLPGK